jgi:hypothetical protein
MEQEKLFITSGGDRYSPKYGEYTTNCNPLMENTGQTKQNEEKIKKQEL